MVYIMSILNDMMSCILLNIHRKIVLSPRMHKKFLNFALKHIAILFFSSNKKVCNYLTGQYLPSQSSFNTNCLITILLS
jgi:hypothetical protein